MYIGIYIFLSGLTLLPICVLVQNITLDIVRLSTNQKLNIVAMIYSRFWDEGFTDIFHQGGGNLNR